MMGQKQKHLVFFFHDQTTGIKFTAEITQNLINYIWAASKQNQQNGMCAQRRLRSAWASAQSELSDQSSQCTQWVAEDPSCFYVDSEDSDQTGRMPRLIWVFAGRTCHFDGFVMRRHNYDAGAVWFDGWGWGLTSFSIYAASEKGQNSGFREWPFDFYGGGGAGRCLWGLIFFLPWRDPVFLFASFTKRTVAFTPVLDIFLQQNRVLEIFSKNLPAHPQLKSNGRSLMSEASSSSLYSVHATAKALARQVRLSLRWPHIR